MADEDAEEYDEETTVEEFADRGVVESDERFDDAAGSLPHSDTAVSILPAEAFFDKLNDTSMRLLIRGVAGSGKTTLLRWAAVQAGKAVDGGRWDDWRARVPFVIHLRDFPSGALPRPSDYPLIIAKELPDPPTGWVNELLDHGRVLLMFDGVDEVPASRRVELRELGFLSARVEPLSPFDRISDVSPLAGLANLVYLDLSDTQVWDVSPLTDLSDLTYVADALTGSLTSIIFAGPGRADCWRSSQRRRSSSSSNSAIASKSLGRPTARLMRISSSRSMQRHRRPNTSSSIERGNKSS